MNKKYSWMWIDWLIFAVRCGWYGTGLTYYYVYMEKLGELSYLEFVMCVSLGFFVPLLFWRPNYTNPTLYAIAELLVSGTFSIYINVILDINLSTSIILMPVLMIGYLLTKKTAPWTIPIFVILLPANRFWTIESQFTFFLQYVDILLFFGIGLGFNLITKSQKRYKNLVQENRKQYEMIQSQNNALEQYAHQVEKYTLLEERNRMARDLHDSIGHYFTTITVGLDAISYMINSDPKLAGQKVNRLAEISREGLNEVRRTIHQIASSTADLPLTNQLETLLKEFEEHTDTKILFEKMGGEVDLNLQRKLSLVRFVQECLTNAKRHGGARFIKVTVQYTKESVELKVYNDGKKIETINFGFGLTSMKNRVEELNGELRIENKEDGVTIICTLPLGGFYEKNKAIARG
ncbi:glucose-6-phosphate-specific signal transduction histidine kinase [Salirhabdus euzebyi]|uniref:histidine kinase n=1 Tax=Salirhabdus euzebyi TaxID=394506 RepID=A0A841Q9Z1_9BACI|nr:sensor histidine kinase [Salirhabdus euzebyi]MBB6455331.1 glucose-6-phosphate-specific signal transduction histidine kinase [Salirhabdus euzebyi]